mmetsp:Transcript_1003/g.1288  ORF Transcript_1003/g.1288 Transcript_1003/m.1288 type:complete len:86 (+) Transcript_1003:163-420(+)
MSLVRLYPQKMATLIFQGKAERSTRNLQQCFLSKLSYHQVSKTEGEVSKVIDHNEMAYYKKLPPPSVSNTSKETEMMSTRTSLSH